MTGQRLLTQKQNTKISVETLNHGKDVQIRTALLMAIENTEPGENRCICRKLPATL